MKVVVAAFNQEMALVGSFSVITNLRMELFEALLVSHHNNIQTAPAPVVLVRDVHAELVRAVPGAGLEPVATVPARAEVQPGDVECLVVQDLQW